MSSNSSTDTIPSHFVVDRQKWFRGLGFKESRLLRSDGKMCCLGFVSKQCGVPDAQLLGIGSPCMLPEAEQLKLPVFMRGDYRIVPSTDKCMEAMSVNDNLNIPDDDREGRLQSIFESNGYKLQFIN